MSTCPISAVQRYEITGNVATNTRNFVDVASQIAPGRCHCLALGAPPRMGWAGLLGGDLFNWEALRFRGQLVLLTKCVRHLTAGNHMSCFI